ncbi:amino acid adenylation domain-containing protein [Bacillus sp. YC2]|uniref:non-ribosomal peptide synthetase/type I polyketide synthase n=1 Tax=Bacillus sp. YC2 TaxID=2861287 RepID=UPI001CA647EE|nr:non-ribosomal peptide synthetase/type I polyketide synthase [Bacillus sp. YC2]MBY8914129.1 amino acid adenylation domain-containing protein [Bacillus sp. YC2]
MGGQTKKIDKADIDNILGLTTIQEGMLFHHLMEPDGSTYFEQMLLQIDGIPDRQMFEEAWNQTVQHHEMLRTLFRWKEVAKPIQIILKRHHTQAAYEDLSENCDLSLEKLKENLIHRDRQMPFDLQEVPFRVTLYKTGQQSSWMLISFHHILMDGWSMGIVLKDWFEAYQSLTKGETAVFPNKPAYQTFVKWQQHHQKKTKAAQAAYWKRLLKDWEPARLLPYSEKALKPNNVFSRIERSLPASDAEALHTFALHNEVTTASVIYGVWGILLKRYSDQEDITFGTTVSGRNAEINGIENMTGLFINTLPLRLHVTSDETPLDIIRRVNEQTAQRSGFEQTPLSELKTYAGLTAEQALFDTIVVIENYPLDQELKSGSLPLGIKGCDMFEQTEFDLTLSVQAFDQNLHFSFIYNPDVMQADQVDKLAEHFCTLVAESVRPVQKPAAKLDMLTEEEKAYQLQGFCRYTGISGDDQRTVIDLFEEQAEKTPHAIAAEFRSEQLTYQELNRKVNQLVYSLEKRGIKPQQRIGILAEHSAEMVIACLAVLKSGSVYVPIDPDYPPERIEYLLSDSGVNMLLTHNIEGLTYSYGGMKLDITDDALYQGKDSNPRKQTDPGHIAYCMYTSGTTGKPKGVLVKHIGLENYITWAADQYVRGEKRDFALYTSLSFDLTVTSIFTPLITGNKIIIYQNRNKQLLAEQIVKDNRAHVIKLTPSHLQLISHLECKQSSVKCLILGGEQLEASLAKKIEDNFGGDIEIFNEYGPTETVVGCMIHKYSSAQDHGVYVPIGRPAAHTDIYVLDSNMNLMPQGSAGELYIAGKGVAKGYLGRESLTKERFVDHPFKPGEKMYKTGDAARFLPEGTIQFLGRNDDQVKLRGYRIETGEIEHWLCKHQDITSAAVAVKKDASQMPCLAAYLKTERDVEEKQLREFLRRHLPEYMIPSHFVTVSEMPLTANGKLNKSALPDLTAQSEVKRDMRLPMSEAETLVLDVWKHVLGKENISADDKFFEIGGSSLHLIQVSQQLSKKTGKDIPMVEMFRRPTVHSMAAFLTAEMGAPKEEEKPKVPPKQNAEADDRIAIIGMAGKFPGAENIEEFWSNLKNGRESISFFSDEELLEAGIQEQTFKRPDYVRAKGVIDGPDLFDASFFGYSPGQAEMMDPQIRLLHEYAWKALEDAGCAAAHYEGKIGLFTGTTSNFQWIQHFTDSLDGRMSELFEVGSLNDIYTVSTRVAHKLNLKGPAITLQTACSTSLVALHLACKSVLNGESDIALAGGASILHPVKSGYVYQENMVKSPDGHCRAFDKDAKGTVGGDGVGFVAVKSLSHALADGDQIYAVVKGSAINNDGSQKVGFNAPSVEGQTEVVKDAIRNAGVDPETISYVEAHGSGTSLGDPIEIEALTKAFQTEKTGFCRIGSVKTNIGHLDAAAGAAGLIKTVLSLKHKQYVPSLHYKEANPNIDFENSPFFVSDESCEWEKASTPRRAGVSSFGMGGTNAHVILEEAPDNRKEERPRTYQLFPLSAKTMNGLEKTRQRLLQKLSVQSDLCAADTAYTLQTGRQHFDYRQMFVASDRNDAVRLLSQPQGRGISRISHVREKQAKKLIFMFTGQGSQYVNMGLDLYREEPYFKETMDRCFQAFFDLTGEKLEDILYPDQEHEEQAAKKLQENKYSQPAIFTIEYALSLLLIKWGLRPWAMIGYSFGEVTSAAVSGVFSLQDAIKLISLRGKAMHEAPPGVMLSVPVPEERLNEILPENLSLAVVNDASCIVSGLEPDIAAFEQQLKSQKMLTMRVKGTTAAHSHIMAQAAVMFGETAQHLSYHKPGIPFFSNLTGEWMTEEDAADYRYWMRHMTETVRFAQGIETLSKQESAIFIEIGPGQDLSVLVKRSIKAEMGQHACNVLRHSRQQMSDVQFLLGKIGTLWMYGAAVDWNSFHEGRSPGKVSLPHYPFEKESFWHSNKPGAAGRKEQPEGGKLPLKEWFYMPQWKQEILPFSGKHDVSDEGVLIFMEDTHFSHKLADELRASHASCTIVQKGGYFHHGKKGEYTICSAAAEHYDMLLDSLEKEQIHISRIVHLWGLAETTVDLSERIRQIKNDCYYSLLYLGQALKKKAAGRETAIFVLSSLAYQTGAEEALYPEKAVHMGPAMVISQETPFLRYRIIDIDRQNPDSWKEDKQIRVILSELYRETGSVLTVYRDQKRFIRHYSRTDIPHESPQELIRQNGVYVIVGGLGFIGLNAAKSLAEKTKGKLVLTSRSDLPARSEWKAWLQDHSEDHHISRKIAAIMEMEAAGAEVMTAACDAASEEDMAELIEKTESGYGKINGVIYAAGITGEHSFSMMDKTDQTFSEQHFRSKMDGVVMLEKVLGDRPLDFCFLLSSLSPILGGLGFTAYTAVNQFVDGFVSKHNSRHPVSWTALNLDGWEFAGGSKPNIPVGGNLEHTLIRAGEGRDVFERIFTFSHTDQIIVSATDLNARIEKYVNRLQTSNDDTVQTEDIQLYGRPELSAEYAEPQTEMEKELLAHWQAFFKIDQIGIDDDFFEMGGDSLKAISFISVIHQAFDVEIALPDFFNIPTIRQMSEYISGADKKVYQKIKKAEKRPYYPLSSAQKRLYLVQQFDKSSTGYNEFTAGRISGNLNMKQVEETFRKLISRHESLRTFFAVKDGTPVQFIAEHADFQADFYDLSHLEEPDADEQKEVIRSFLKPFELDKAPLMRVGVMKLKEKEYVLMLDMHHIISDGLSQDILVSEFMELYDGKQLAPLELQFKDFSEWQNDLLQSAQLQEVKEYWLKRLNGMKELNLPSDYDRPDIKSFAGAHYHFRIGAEELAAFKKIIAEEDATLFMGLLSVYQILLHKLSGQSDIVVGVPVAGRRQEELQRIIGIFVNMLPLRFYPEKDMSFNQFLNHVKQLVIEDFAHQDYQYEHMVQDLKLERSLSRNLLFDTVFALQNLQQPSLEVGGIKLTDYEYETAVSRFDLLWIAYETENGLSSVIEYSTELFSRETVESIVTGVKEVFASVIADKHTALKDITLSSGAEDLEEVSLLELDDLKI